jgi:hypothetical protein
MYVGDFAAWRDGVHDVRHLRYEHPWGVVIGGRFYGFWSRERARVYWRHVRE